MGRRPLLPGFLGFRHPQALGDTMHIFRGWQVSRGLFPDNSAQAEDLGVPSGSIGSWRGPGEDGIPTSVPNCPAHPGGSHLDHLGHVALGPCVVRLVFHSDQHNEVQVVPHVMFKLDVLFK